MINVPFAMKTRVSTFISSSHVPTTGGFTEPPAFNNLLQGASRPYHFSSTCTFQGHFLLCSLHPRSSRAGSRRFMVPICHLSEVSLPVNREAQVVCDILKVLGLVSLGILFKPHRVSKSLLVHLRMDCESAFRILFYLSIRPAPFGFYCRNIAI